MIDRMAIANAGVALVLSETTIALRDEPEMVAPLVGLRYCGTWNGERHFTCPEPQPEPVVEP